MEEMFSTCVQDNNTRNICNFTQKLSQPYRKNGASAVSDPPLFISYNGR